MKHLIILSGIPGAGKSTLCESLKAQYGEDVILSPDTIREMCGCIVRDADGNPVEISQDANGLVFNIFYKMMRARMEHGATIVVDATNTSKNALKQMRELAEEFGYEVTLHRVECPLEVVLERNLHRGYKAVPEAVIRRMYDAFTNFEFEDWYELVVHKYNP